MSSLKLNDETAATVLSWATRALLVDSENSPQEIKHTLIEVGLNGFAREYVINLSCDACQQLGFVRATRRRANLIPTGRPVASPGQDDQEPVRSLLLAAVIAATHDEKLAEMRDLRASPG